MANFSILSYEFRTIKEPQDMTLFPRRTSEEEQEIFSHKQDYFDRFFKPDNLPSHFERNGRFYRVKLLWHFNGIIVFQMERRGSFKQRIDFKVKKIQNDPWVDIVIDNRKERQLIAVRKNTAVFKPHTVAAILEANISKWLKKECGLEVEIKAQYHSKVFWNLYNKYEKTHGIQSLLFKFPFPNKDWLSEDIKKWQSFGKERNGATRIGLEAAKNEKLYFTKNKENDDIVNAFSGTGHDIVIKPVRHKVIHVAKEMNPVEQEMDERTFNKVFSSEASSSLFEKNDTAAYERAGEFLNKCQQYYD